MSASTDTCCFSAFKQHFASGQLFTYDQVDLARFYGDYVELMAHYDAVLPGRIHRVYYERVVADLPGEVQRLLEKVPSTAGATKNPPASI